MELTRHGTGVESILVNRASTVSPSKNCRTGELCSFNGKDFTEMLNTRILLVLPVKEMLSGLNFQPTGLLLI